MKNEFWETKGKDITNKALPDTGDQSEDPVIKEIQLCITYVDGNKIFFMKCVLCHGRADWPAWLCFHWLRTSTRFCLTPSLKKC